MYFSFPSFHSNHNQTTTEYTMAPVPDVQFIEFKTLDGLTLRGSYYATLQRAPAVVMTPGVSTPRIAFKDNGKPPMLTNSPNTK